MKSKYLPQEFKGIAVHECMAADLIVTPQPAVRQLKIEAGGDPWKGRVTPKIRLMGRCLERAGFRPGSQVQVWCVAPGVIELRSPEVVTANTAHQPAQVRFY